MASGFVLLVALVVLAMLAMLLLLPQRMLANICRDRTSDGTSRSSQEAMTSLVAQKCSSRPPQQGRA